MPDDRMEMLHAIALPKHHREADEDQKASE